jgi:hypothetical protein
MNYDPSQYRALGVGERISAQHFVTMDGYVIDPIPVSNSSVGMVVTEDLDCIYLERIPPDKTIFPTGAARSNADGRGRFDLVPYEAILALARRFEMGAVQFGENNWLKGQPLSRLLSSMRRHAHQINYDFSEDHLGAVLWNAAAFVTMVSRIEAGLVDRSVDDIGWFQNKEASKQ